MSVTQTVLDDFHEFATRLLDAEPAELSWDELLIRWQSVHERDVTNEAIREGLADVDAGRHQPADEAMREVRAALNCKD